MKTRNLVVLVLVMAAAVAATGCGSDATVASGGQSTTSPTSASSKTTTAKGSSSDGSSNTTLPDLSKLGSSDCLAAATSFGEMAGLAMTGKSDDAKKAQDEIDKLKSQVPSDLQADLQTLADAYKALSTEGIVKGSQDFDTPAVQKASADVEAYFTHTCGVGTTTP